MALLGRITDLLDAVAACGGRGAGAGTLAASAGLPVATATRLLKALAAHGWVDQDGNRGAYRAGPRIQVLAVQAPYRAQLFAAAVPAARRLAARHPGCHAVLSALRPWERFALWHSRSGVELHGERTLWGSAGGRLLVAFLPPRERARWIARIPPPTPDEWAGVIDRRELADALHALRCAGPLAERRGRGRDQVCSAAALIADPSGAPVALGLYRQGPPLASAALRDLARTAQRIAARLESDG